MELPSKLLSLIQETRLLSNSLVLAVRSRRGFNILLALIRVVGVVAIVISLAVVGILGKVASVVIFGIYVTFALATLVISFINRDISQSSAFHITCIIIDSFAISFFIFYEQSLNSQLYLLLLLPLITSAHFLVHKIATPFIIMTFTFYAVALALIQWSSGNFSILNTFWTWSSRVIFLSISSWLYRVQRNLPSAHETRVISPKTARRQIEHLLRSLKVVVPYDSISLQLLYRDRLVIVACLGFPNPDEIYRIEFPVHDANFPNHKVISTRRYCITDTKEYPAFLDPAYCARHIKTWMGIPLISPSTDELLGLLSIDSKKTNAFTRNDAHRSEWFAKRVSAFLIEAALGPAALTQATRREAIEKVIELWEKRIAERTVYCVDDIQAASNIVEIGKEVFMVEDCSFYLLRQTNLAEREKSRRVLHLVASSTIPSREFLNYESKVSDQKGGGLTGYAVFKNKTLNLSATEIKNSPYRAGEFKKHLDHFTTHRSKQMMVTSIRDHVRRPIGALKLENKIGRTSDNRFPILEQRLFEIFANMVGLIIEGIRQRNYSTRQQQALHNVRGQLSDAVIKPLESIWNTPGITIASDSTQIEIIKRGCSYVATVIDNILFDPANDLHLENAGLISALTIYVSLLNGNPSYREACARVRFLPTKTRDMLPYPIRVAFFNVGREALLNAIRHAQVEQNPQGKIDVEFFQKEVTGDNSYVLRVEDNGHGFNLTEKKEAPTSFGLAEMDHQKKVMQDLGTYANLDIDTTPGSGTKVTAVWKP